VLSAYGVLGSKAGTLSAHKTKMAMAVRGTRRPRYNRSDILPRHFEQMGQRCGIGSETRRMMDDLSEKTESVVQLVQGSLPAGFPLDLAHDVLTGLRSSADLMKAR
jgi:serine/threonine-protein kinase HipA